VLFIVGDVENVLLARIVFWVDVAHIVVDQLDVVGAVDFQVEMVRVGYLILTHMGSQPVFVVLHVHRVDVGDACQTIGHLTIRIRIRRRRRRRRLIVIPSRCICIECCIRIRTSINLLRLRIVHIHYFGYNLAFILHIGVIDIVIIVCLHD